MLGKAHQPTAPCQRATRRGRRESERRGTLQLPVFLAVPIAVLALAAPASAAGPLTDVLDTVAEATAPAVDGAVSAPAPLAPSPAAAQQTGDVAPGTAPADRAAEQTTGSSTTRSVGALEGALAAASAHHDQPAGGAPADRPQSAPRSGAGPDASSSTPSRASGNGDATTSASPQRPSDPVGGVVHGVALAANRAGRGVSRAAAPISADRALARSRLPGVARRLVQTPSARIATLPAPLARTLTLPWLSQVAVLPELPSLSTLPVLALLPSLSILPALMAPPESEQSPVAVFTAAPPPPPAAPSPPIALSLPAAAVGGDTAPSTATALQGAWQASIVEQAYGATANGMRGAMGAPDRGGSRSSAVGALRRAPTWAASRAASAYGFSGGDGTAPAAPGTASSGGAYRQPSPAPVPGGASPATGAVAGPSIPVLLTLAGLLLLAAPCVRRVLRLLGESWRLSPLALILERPG